MSAQNLTRVVSPFGVASWPALNTPDEYEGKKSWKVDLIFDPDPEVDAMLEQLEAAYQESIEGAKAEAEEAGLDARGRAREVEPNDRPWWDEVDKETGAKSGRIVVRFRSKAEYKDKRSGEMRPIRLEVVDAFKRPVKEQVGGGSILRVITDLNPYYFNGKAGISLRLAAVQVKELRAGYANVSDGFGEVEGGFESEGAAEAVADGDDY